MKTSTKILLTMLVVLVMIPATILFALSYKVRNGDYVIKVSEYEQNARRSTPITNAQFMKLTAEGGAELTCTIHYSDSVYYRKFGNSEDSLQVKRSGDTLEFTVSTTANETADKRDAIYLDIFMPFSGLLLLDGVEANLDTTAATANIEVQMANNSSFTIGSEEREGKFPLKFASLWVRSENSAVSIRNKTTIGSLKLEMNGTGKLFLGDDLQLNTIEGSVAGSTSLQGPSNLIFALKPTP